MHFDYNLWIKLVVLAMKPQTWSNLAKMNGNFFIAGELVQKQTFTAERYLRKHESSQPYYTVHSDVQGLCS